MPPEVTGDGVEGAGRTDELATKQPEDGRAVAAAPEPVVLRGVTLGEAVTSGRPPLGPEAPPGERLAAFLDAVISLASRNAGLPTAHQHAVATRKVSSLREPWRQPAIRAPVTVRMPEPRPVFPAQNSHYPFGQVFF